jgi:hypothetical protein
VWDRVTPPLRDWHVLAARATVAIRLISRGHIDPHLALSYVVWPTARMLEAEARCPVETVRSRAWKEAA